MYREEAMRRGFASRLNQPFSYELALVQQTKSDILVHVSESVARSVDPIAHMSVLMRFRVAHAH
jgi:hypothetical protein